MPLGPQPRGARGTVGHPYSALRLRLVLALFGLILCTVLTVMLLRAGFRVLGVLMAVPAVVALVDIVVIQLRRRAGHRTRDAAG